MNLNGLVLIDKPQGISSNILLQKIKRLFEAQKAGHTGTLDPLATGMLPICFGEATKWSQFLLDSDKCYLVSAALGSKTDTGDVTGNIIEKNTNFSVSLSQLEAVLSLFRGDINQIPPMYSALKHQGKPLYKYARAGENVIRRPRWVSIKNLKLIKFEDNIFTLEVLCTKGTYIRTLIEDIGNTLGCGAHVSKLRRLYTQNFVNNRMYTIEEIESLPSIERKNILLPMDIMLTDYNKIILNAENVKKLYLGQLVILTEYYQEDLYSLYDIDGNLLGIGFVYKDSSNLCLKSKRLCKITIDT